MVQFEPGPLDKDKGTPENGFTGTLLAPSLPENAFLFEAPIFQVSGIKAFSLYLFMH
jgi:hypothetical protein